MKQSIRNVGDFLSEIERVNDHDKKVGLLKKIITTHWAVPLLTYIRYAFDTRIQFNIPDGDFPYKASNRQSKNAKLDLYLAERTLWIYNKVNPVVRYHEFYSLDYDEQGISAAEKARRYEIKILRERHYRCLLESLSFIESRVLDQDVRQKKMVRYIPSASIQEAFGEWIPKQYLVCDVTIPDTLPKESELTNNEIHTVEAEYEKISTGEKVDEIYETLKDDKKYDPDVVRNRTYWASKQEEKLHRQYMKLKGK